MSQSIVVVWYSVTVVAGSCMFVVFILCFDVIVFAYCPMEICCSFIVSLYVLCLGKFKASGNKVVNCFLKLPTDSAHWVSAIFQDLVLVVVGLDA